jgi:hypothetical protein
VALLTDVPDGQRGDAFPQPVIRREHSVIPMPVLPRRRHEIGAPVQKLKRREFDDAVGSRPGGLPAAAGPDPVDAGSGLSQLDIPLDAPKVSHPLLRRLGQSPFTGVAAFPLVGLLASCYDTISRDALRAAEEPTMQAPGTDQPE